MGNFKLWFYYCSSICSARETVQLSKCSAFFSPFGLLLLSFSAFEKFSFFCKILTIQSYSFMHLRHVFSRIFSSSFEITSAVSINTVFFFAGKAIFLVYIAPLKESLQSGLTYKKKLET